VTFHDEASPLDWLLRFFSVSPKRLVTRKAAAVYVSSVIRPIRWRRVRREPNAAVAEEHTLVKPPFIYACHTLRYIDPALVTRATGSHRIWKALVARLFAMQRPFAIEVEAKTSG
jgi:hypothetical protein